MCAYSVAAAATMNKYTKNYKVRNSDKTIFDFEAEKWLHRHIYTHNHVNKITGWGFSAKSFSAAKFK